MTGVRARTREDAGLKPGATLNSRRRAAWKPFDRTQGKAALRNEEKADPSPPFLHQPFAPAYRGQARGGLTDFLSARGCLAFPLLRQRVKISTALFQHAGTHQLLN